MRLRGGLMEPRSMTPNGLIQTAVAAAFFLPALKNAPTRVDPLTQPRVIHFAKGCPLARLHAAGGCKAQSPLIKNAQERTAVAATLPVSPTPGPSSVQ